MSKQGMNTGKETKEKKADLQSDPKSGSTQLSGEERGCCVRKWHTSGFNEDYRPLPSPSRSALRSSCSPPRSSKLRVTFQQDSSNKSLKSSHSNDTASPALWKTGQQPLLTPTQWKHKTESSYSDSVPTEDPTPQSPDRVLDSQYFTDACWPALKPNVISGTWPLPHNSSELESRADKLLQLTSDLYEVTYLPDVAIPVWSFSEECPEQSSPHCTFFMESLLQPYKHKPQQTLSTQTAPWRLDERLARGLKTKKQTLLPEGMRASWLGPVFQADGPDLCDVLRALLDLVDQHWSGPLSLHLSPSFMAKAIRLLMPLTDPVPPLQNETTKEINNERNEMEDSREQWHVRNATQEKREQENKQIGVEERRCWRQSRLDFDVSEAGYLKKQLAKTEKELELLKKRLISSVKENYTLRSDNKKVTACWKTEVQPLDLCAYLQKESEVLQEHDKLLKQLEQTLYLLQSNQRSLVTHNNSLLDAIKRRTSKLSDTV